MLLAIELIRPDSLFVFDDIAYSPYSLYKPYTKNIVDFAPYVSDLDIYDVGFADIVVTADSVHKLFTIHDYIFIFHEHINQLIFSIG